MAGCAQRAGRNRPIGPTACSTRTRSRRPICGCSSSRAAPGPGRSSCAPGSRRFDRSRATGVGPERNFHAAALFFVGVSERTLARGRRMLGTILLIILILLLLGALPTWPHSRSWGYYPSGGLGLILIIVLILVLMGRI